MTPELLHEIRSCLWQYQSDMKFPVNDEGSRQRRIERAQKVLDKIGGDA